MKQEGVAMKLNVDILCDALESEVKIHRWGKGRKTLSLERPVFFDGKNKVFEENHLYICMTDRLPLKPVIKKGAVLLCVGSRPSASYTAGQNHSCCVWVDEADLFTVFNMVQHVFDKYERWEESIRHIMETSGNLQEIVDCCFPIFDNPLVIMDSDFHVLAYSEVLDQDEAMAYLRPDQDNKYAASLISESLLSAEYNRAQQNAFTVVEPDRDVVHFSTNLYTNGIFVGNLKISFALRPHRESDNALACYLARILERVFFYNPRLMDGRVTPLSGILKDILNGVPVDLSRRQHLYTGGMEGWYFCAKIVPSNRTASKVTSSYILRHIQTTFPGCCAFEMDAHLVAVIDLAKLGLDEKTMLHNMEIFLKEMDLKAGISCPFQDLLTSQPRFRQATLALELGSTIDPGKRCHCFADYKLTYMSLSSLGEFSAESMMTPGLQRLTLHDINSNTNYVETLRVYLNNNMNSSKTSQELYIHRSTFQERIQRIESILEADLSDAKQRLYLMMMLQIMEGQNMNKSLSPEKMPQPEPKEPKIKVKIRILDEYR